MPSPVSCVTIPAAQSPGTEPCKTNNYSFLASINSGCLKTVQSTTKKQRTSFEKSSLLPDSFPFDLTALKGEKKPGVDSESLKQQLCSKRVTDSRSQELSDIRVFQEEDLSQA